LKQQVYPACASDTNWFLTVNFLYHPWVYKNASVRDLFKFWHVLGLLCLQIVPILSRNCNPLLLEPIPELDFFEEQHRYRWRNNWILENVSDVLQGELNAFAKKKIEKTKHGEDGWLVRGKTIHRSLDCYLRGEPDTHDDKWSPWIDALLSDELFQGIETLATEFCVVDRFNSVAGSFDFLVRYKDDPSFVILGDLKTVSSAKAVSGRKAATGQLGAYTKMLGQHFGYISVTQCVTVVSGPEKCKVIRQQPEDCINAWEEAFGKHQARCASFDF